MGEQATRMETDSLGPIEVPAGRLWGAQTERSHCHPDPRPLSHVHDLPPVAPTQRGGLS